MTIAGWSRPDYVDTLANEVPIAASGSWPEQVRLRAAIGLGYFLPHRVLLLGPVVLSFFLAGMSVVRRPGPSGDGPVGMPFVDMGRDDASRYWSMCASGVTVGVLIAVGAEGVRGAWPRSLVAVAVYWAATLGGAAVQAAGYAAGVLAFSVRRPNGAIARSLALVGRAALSNYVLQSLLLGLVFYRPGLGLVTRMTALPTVALAVPIFAAEVWLSRWYLARCAMGPIEWAWRSVSYGRRLDFRR